MNDLVLIQKHELEAMILTQVRKALSEVANIKTNTSKNEMPIGIDRAVEITGYKKPTIYSKVSRRELPGYHRGQKLFFYESELIDWINSGKRCTKEAIIAGAIATLEK
jgi:predicted DNA-binding transcriptional regulator AlpA